MTSYLAFLDVSKSHDLEGGIVVHDEALWC